MDLEADPGHIPRVRTRASEAASETAFALLDGLWRAPVGIALFDRSLRFVQVNDHLAEISGLAPEVHVGRSMGELFPGAAAQNLVVESRVREVVETGRPILNQSIPGGFGDHSAREWLASYFPVVASSGEVRAVCAMVVDATEDRERHAALVRARDEAERRARRLALLQDMTAALSAAHEPAAVAAVFVDRVRSLFDAQTAIIRQLHPDGRLSLLAASAMPGLDVPRVPDLCIDDDLPVSFSVRRDEAVWLESPAVVAARFPRLGEVLRGTRLGAVVAVPLVARGHMLGSFAVTFEGPRWFDLEERAFVLSVAEQCAQALDRAMLFASEREALARTQRVGRRLSRLQAITSALGRTRTAGDVGRVLVEEAERTLGAVSTVVYVREQTGALRLVAQSGRSAGKDERGALLAPEAGLPAAAVTRTGEPCWLETRDEFLAAFPAALTTPFPPERVPASAAAIPLRSSGNILGAIGLAFAERHPLEPDDRALLLTVAGQASQALERALLFDRERSAREEAERARALLDAIVDNAPIGIGFLDRELRFVRLNEVLADIDGFPVTDHLGKTMREVLPGMPADEIERAFRRVLATGVPVLDQEVSGETPAAPGKVRWWRYSYYPVRAGGEIVGTGALVREVTAEKESDEFQRNVLGIVSHDLRNPLGAVVTAARVLARGEDVTARQARLVGRLLGSAERMDRIVQVLLDYAQARGGQGIPIRPGACDVAAICEMVSDECEATHPGREVIRAGTGDGAVEWDVDRLGQALSNLVSNALEYSPPGTPVRLEWRADGDGVEIDVANAGDLIPSEVLPHLFEAFRRGPPRADRRQGLGLGLFIARAIVTAHGGRIEVRSGLESGTVFTLRLPRRVGRR